MDIREQPKQSPKELEEIADLDASNEALIYNLVKRVDLRNQILTQFNEALTRPRSKLSFIDKYVHSWTVLVWTGAAAAYMAYRRSTHICQLRVQHAVSSFQRVCFAEP